MNVLRRYIEKVRPDYIPETYTKEDALDRQALINKSDKKMLPIGLWLFFLRMEGRYKVWLIFLGLLSLFNAVISTSSYALVITTVFYTFRSDIPVELGSLSVVGYIQGIFEFFGIAFRERYLVIVTLTILTVDTLLKLFQNILSGRFLSLHAHVNRVALNNSIVNASWLFFLKKDHSNITHASINMVNRYQSLVAFYPNFLRSASLLIISLIATFYISWQFSLLVAGFSIFTIPLLSIPIRKIRALGNNLNSVDAGFMKEINQSYTNSKLIKASGHEKRAAKRLMETSAGALKIRNRVTSVEGISFLLTTLSTNFVLFTGLVIAGIYLPITPDQLGLSAILLYRFQNGLNALLGSFQSVGFHFATANKFDNMRAEAALHGETSGSYRFESLKSHLEFHKVYFSYPSSDEENNEAVLNGLSLKIPRGKIVALVGGSGAGKTTIIDLALGLMPPTDGYISIDGRNFKEYDVKSWRTHISYVSQGSILFRDTVLNNLRWFRPDASLEDVKEAARLALASNFIDRLPAGYDTVVGGVQNIGLSGGQRQRIAIARAMLSNQNFFILDEATSELDVKTEAAVHRNIINKHKDATILLAAHRLVTTMSADIVYVLANGKVEESGAPRELIEQKGIYYSYWKIAMTHRKESSDEYSIDSLLSAVGIK